MITCTNLAGTNFYRGLQNHPRIKQNTFTFCKNRDGLIPISNLQLTLCKGLLFIPKKLSGSQDSCTNRIKKKYFFRQIHFSITHHKMLSCKFNLNKIPSERKTPI